MNTRVADAPIAVETPRPLGRPYLVALAVLLVAAVALLAGTPRRPGSGHDVDFVLAAMAVVALVVSATRSLLRWRLEDAAPALSAAAVLVLAAATIALADLSALGVASDVGQLLSAGCFVGMCAVILQAWDLRVVDSRARPQQVSLVALVAVLAVLPMLFVLDLQLPRNVPEATRPVGEAILLGSAWTAVALCCTVQGWRRGRSTFVWLGLLALAMALHEGLVGAAAADGRLPAAGHGALLLLGALMATHGVDRDLRAAFAEREAQLRITQAEVEAAIAEMDAARSTVRAHVHEARNALTAIGGAVQLLERRDDRLPPETRAELASALTKQVAHLQELLAEDVAAFDRAGDRA